MHRVFIGLDIPQSFWPVLDDARFGVEDARWQRDDQLHLTLAFVGSVSRKVLRDIEGELAGLAFNPFPLSLAGVGAFGKDGAVRALWAGVEDPQPVATLHEKIMHRLGGLGLMLDQRRFVPHITLARFARRARPDIEAWFQQNETLTTQTEWVTHFSIYTSHKTDEGRYYRREATFGTSFEDLSHEEHLAPDTPSQDHRASADWYMAGEPMPVWG